MPSSQNGNIGINSGYTPGDNGWTAQHNFNWDALDALVQPTVISVTTTAPPGSPANGNAYVVPSGATGAWASQTNKIAVWVGRSSAWAFYTPKNGWQVYNQADKSDYVFNGTSWATYQDPKGLRGTYASRPAATSIPAGTVYYATDVLEAYWSDGATWSVLPTSGGELGYAEITSTFTTTSTTPVDVTGLSVTCMVGEKPIYIDAGGDVRNQTSTAQAIIYVIANGVQVSRMIVVGGFFQNSRKTRVSGLTPGSTYTFKLQLSTGGSGTADLYGDASDKPYIRVSNT